MKNVEVSAKIPEVIAKAILSAIKDMPSLRKADLNAFGKYAFVSIDDYLAEVPRTAAKHGLFWITRETDCQVIGEKGNHLAYTFVLDLAHEDGTFLPEYAKITVVHPLQGAQTAGSALAYGEKMLTRFVFKVVTGEQDADATDGRAPGESLKRPEPPRETGRQVPPQPKVPDEPKPDLSAAPAPVVGGIAHGGVKVTEDEKGVPIVSPPKEGGGWENVAEVFKTFAPRCSSEEELSDFWNGNIKALDMLKVGDAALYKTVKGVFQTSKKALAAKGAN